MFFFLDLWPTSWMELEVEELLLLWLLMFWWLAGSHKPCNGQSLTAIQQLPLDAGSPPSTRSSAKPYSRLSAPTTFPPRASTMNCRP